MDPNPPRPEYQIIIMFPIAVEMIAVIYENDYLLVGTLVLIVIVAALWYRHANRGRRKPKYDPAKNEPHEDWGGKRGDDGKPL